VIARRGVGAELRACAGVDRDQTVLAKLGLADHQDAAYGERPAEVRWNSGCNGAGYVSGVEATELIALGAAELAAQEAAELIALLVEAPCARVVVASMDRVQGAPEDS
jgi:hypothetical protein